MLSAPPGGIASGFLPSSCCAVSFLCVWTSQDVKYHVKNKWSMWGVPANPLMIFPWTDSILLCNLQKQHRAWHNEDWETDLKPRKNLDLSPRSLDLRNCPSVATALFFSGMGILTDQEILYNMDFGAESYSQVEHQWRCRALFLSSIDVLLDQPQCGENPPSASLLCPVLFITPLLPLAVCFFSAELSQYSRN